MLDHILLAPTVPQDLCCTHLVANSDLKKQNGKTCRRILGYVKPSSWTIGQSALKFQAPLELQTWIPSRFSNSLLCLSKGWFCFSLFLHTRYVYNQWKTDLLRVSFYMGSSPLTNNWAIEKIPQAVKLGIIRIGLSWRGWISRVSYRVK